MKKIFVLMLVSTMLFTTLSTVSATNTVVHKSTITQQNIDLENLSKTSKIQGFSDKKFVTTVIDSSSNLRLESLSKNQSRDLVTYVIYILCKGIVTTIIKEYTNSDSIGEFVVSWAIVNFPGEPYSYTYTADDGCCSPEFPANPFCRRVIL